MTDTDYDRYETFHVYTHGSKKDESAYELADSLADDNTGDPWDDTLHSTLLYLATEATLTFRLDTQTDEIDLIGVKSGEHSLGEPLSDKEVSWNYEFEKPSPPSDQVGCTTHMSVSVKTPDGETRSALACEIAEEDINDDGTVSFPLSGECDHD